MQCGDLAALLSGCYTHLRKLVPVVFKLHPRGGQKIFNVKYLIFDRRWSLRQKAEIGGHGIDLFGI